MERKVIPLEIIDDVEESGVSKISLVDVPAIDRDWMAFKRQEFVEPNSGERETDFIPRCIAYNVNEGKDTDQAAAICYSVWQNHAAKFNIEPNPCWAGYEPYGLKDDGTPNCIPVKNAKDLPLDLDAFPEMGVSYGYSKVSFDYDDTLSTGDGLRVAMKNKEAGDTLYIISARNKISKGMLARAKELDIPTSRVFATGSNEAKVAKVKELGIDQHIDNNSDVVKQLGANGVKFFLAAETYTDYPEGAVNNAKRALEWADKNGWGDCGMGAGKARANQLANREPISEDTIARMSAFERHRQNSDTPYSEGCGKLMWDAWGGDAGIRWAHNKLREIRGEDFDYVLDLPAYTDQTGKKKKEKFENLVDTITLDVPLFIRLMELAKEDIKNDVDLHRLSEIASDLSEDGHTLTMADYPALTSELPELSASPVSTDPSVTIARGHVLTIVAGQDTPKHGLTVELKNTGGYDVKYWYNTVDNVVPQEVKVDGQPVSAAANTVYLGYHTQRPLEMKKQIFTSEDQQIVVGPAMIPDMEIVRKDEETGEPYWVSFSQDVVKRIAEKFMRELRNHDTNVQHEAGSDAGSYVMETWLVENAEDKANSMYGFDVPVGTWMIKMRVVDPMVWKAIKAGKLNGFSIEGSFMSEKDYESYKKDRQLYDRVMKILKSV